MDAPEWPLPPIRPEHLPLIRGLLSPEDYEKLLKRIKDDPAGWLPTHERAPERRWDARGFYSIRRSRMVSPTSMARDMPSADTTLVVFSVNVFPSIP